MSTNLVQLGLQYLTPEVIARIASALGVDRTLVGKAVTAVLPVLLRSLAGIASTPGGAAKLDQAISRQRPGILEDLSANLGGPGQQDFIKGGTDDLSSLLGPSSVPTLASALGKFSGLDQPASSSLLGMAAPMVLGLLGQQKEKQGLDAQGIAELLESQDDNVAAAMPKGFDKLLSDTGIPGFTSSVRPSTWSMPKTPSAAMSSNQLMWLLPIAVIAGLAWWLLADRGGEVAQKTSPIQTGSIEQPIHPGSLVVNDTNLGQTWDKAVNGLTRALVTVTDKASAEAALPKLQSAAEEFQQLSTQSNELPMEGRSALATLVTKARPSIEDLFVKILEIPGVSEVAKPVIDTLRTHLDKLAQA